MVRAAAKNFESVGVVVEPARYAALIGELREHGGLTHATRKALAAAAYAHTAAYDAAVASWFARRSPATTPCPPTWGSPTSASPSCATARTRISAAPSTARPPRPARSGGAAVLQGKEMSFNNWLDAYAAYELASALPEHAAVIVKHNNPCGAAPRRRRRSPTARRSRATR